MHIFLLHTYSLRNQILLYTQSLCNQLLLHIYSLRKQVNPHQLGWHSLVWQCNSITTYILHGTHCSTFVFTILSLLLCLYYNVFSYTVLILNYQIDITHFPHRVSVHGLATFFTFRLKVKNVAKPSKVLILEFQSSTKRYVLSTLTLIDLGLEDQMVTQ